ncbi:NERD domain-containing protein [Salinibacterium sp. dk2585]|uniref:nuclease-related domain-containing protein n=1 Tax=unclassified Salinibacterium TaxID=2632331 RepID=UPI0011C24524|nr:MULTISPECIES: nuclease-related domain-containing protein [unclassified Salinibacterium]QEE62044.1 NERD domain-containing protein [Salinibacterium sp. dk2585]TXK52210.1 NERD domain-containing protein [Salinibacterium sp. dk5596]
MNDFAPAQAAELLTYPAGYGVVRECLEQQQQAATRSGVARFFGVNPLHPDARSWYGGALGEMRVGEVLERLGQEWSVFHAVPVGTRGSDIDHVVVGPGGVFTINTKRHPGAKVWLGERMLLVAGQKTDHLRNSRHEASRAAKLLTAAAGMPVDVRPLLVLVAINSMTVKRRPSDVVVITDSQLLRWLGKRQRVLSDEQVRQMADAAGQVRTWHKTERVVVDLEQIAAFEALSHEVERARTRRLLWAAASLVGLIGGGLAAANAALGALVGL